MTPIILYALKVFVCSALLTGYYYIALRNKAFHQWNRFYLLLTVVLSLTVPLARFTLFQTPEDTNAAIQLLHTINGDGAELVMAGEATPAPAFNWQLLATVFYSGVSLLLLAVLVCSIARLLALVRRHTAQEVEDIHFINTDDVPGTPFSFLRYIFWNRSIDINSPTGRQILKHELVHVREWHTADKLFLQVVLIAAWFNPVFWIIRHEIKMIHEFIADNKAVQGRDASALAAMILQAAYPTRFNHLVNPFFHHSIKRRLRMLTKIQNPRVNYFSRIMMLPVVALIVFLFSVKATGQTGAPPLEKKMVVVIDAGHGKSGGQFSGARNEGAYEDQIVLDIANQVQALNTDGNLVIVLTRNGDESIELSKRVAVAKEAKADLFISLHMNSSPKQMQSGLEIRVPKADNRYSKESQRLASAMGQSLSTIGLGEPKILQPQNANIYVLKENQCPAILIECGYITHNRELLFVGRVEGQKAIAHHILEGIALYANATTKSAKPSVTSATQPTVQATAKKQNMESTTLDPAANIESVDIDTKSITINYKDGTKETLSAAEARKKGLIPDAMQEGGTWEQRNAQHQSVGNTANTFRLKGYISDLLIVINGKVSDEAAMKRLNPNLIDRVNVLKGETAIAKYGTKGAAGVIEVTIKSNPLIIIDGIPADEATMKAMNPNRIDKIDVLKGEKAMAVYGEKAADGVIVITTKQGSLQEDSTLKEVVVQGYKLPKTAVADKPSLKEVTVTGHKINKVTDGSDLKETVVVGYAKAQKGAQENEPIFVKMDQPASFPEEIGGLSNFLASHLNVNTAAKNGAPSGKYTVVLQLLIKKDGTIAEIKPLTNKSYGMEEEVIRVMKLSPKWTPARQNGHDVSSYYKLPVTFVVDGRETPVTKL